MRRRKQSNRVPAGRRATRKGKGFPLKDAVILGGTVGAMSAVTPSAAPVYVVLGPMAYEWYKTRHMLTEKPKSKRKLKKVM